MSVRFSLVCHSLFVDTVYGLVQVGTCRYGLVQFVTVYLLIQYMVWYKLVQFSWYMSVRFSPVCHSLFVDTVYKWYMSVRFSPVCHSLFVDTVYGLVQVGTCRYGLVQFVTVYLLIQYMVWYKLVQFSWYMSVRFSPVCHSLFVDTVYGLVQVGTV